MTTTQNQSPVTLPVTDLDDAATFYLSALRPLGYCVISRVNHSTSGVSSEAVGLGPENSSRVDLFLSKSSRTAAERHGGKTAHLVFPAPSKIAVHDFYSDGLKAGGKASHSPHVKHKEQGLFAATLMDDDGNKLEVCYCEPGATPPDPDSPSSRNFEPCEHVDSWTSNIDNANRQVSRRSFSRSEMAPDSNTHDSRVVQARQPATRTTYYPIDAARDRPASVVSRGNSVRSSSSRKSRSNRDELDSGGHREHQPSSNGGSSHAVVGTLLGAAAGAAVAYAFAKSAEDSRQKEEEFERKMRLKREAKAEAKAHSMAMDWRERARSSRGGSRKRRDGPAAATVEKDSGYQSTDRREASPPVREIRRFAYPQRGRRSSNDSGDKSWSGREDEYPKSKGRLPTRSRTLRDGRRIITVGGERKPSPPPPPTLGPSRRRSFSLQSQKRSGPSPSRRGGSATGSRSPARTSTKAAPAQQQSTSTSRPDKGEDRTETGSRTSRGSHGSRSTVRKQSPLSKFSSTYTRVKVPPSPPPSYKSTVHSAHVAQDHTRSILGNQYEDRKDEFWNQDDDLDTLVPDDSISVADGPPSMRRAMKMDSSKSGNSSSKSRRTMGGRGNIEGVVMV